MRTMIDFEIPAWVRRARTIVLVPALLAGAVAVVHAGPPATFVNDETLSADKLNSNFGGLDSRLSKLEGESTTVTRNGKSMKTTATYCGATAGQWTGNVGGYASTKALCENVSACNSPTAHVCTGEELVRSMTLGVSVPMKGWYMTGYATVTGSNYHSNDCNGFTSTVNWGKTWTSTGPSPDDADCVDAYPFICCD